MNHRVLSGLPLWLAIISTASACGPFFPDTVLDQPQAALDVPSLSYTRELHRLTGTPVPSADEKAESENDLLDQIPLEQEELRAEWSEKGIAAEKIERWLDQYEEVRKALLDGINSVKLMNFPNRPGSDLPMKPRPLGAEYPTDVADYVEAARLHAIGKTEEARSLWRAILERPAAARRFRGTWSAWMLAKTSSDLPECLGWYERVEQEAAAGGHDCLALAPAAKAWRAPRVSDPIEGLHLSYDAFRAGREQAAAEVRELSTHLLDDGDSVILAKAAADPIVRPLLNLQLHASMDGPHFRNAVEAEPLPPGPARSWLNALENHAPLPLEGGARVAWSLYASGRFDEARHWLDLSVSTEPLAQWLQAKFDLRYGNIQAANLHLAAAIRSMSAKDDWHPGNPPDGFGWVDDNGNVRDATQGRLLADAGVVSLAQGEYLKALDSLRKGGYAEDAAYVAESILSTDELLAHVKDVAPQWTEVPPEKDDHDAEDLVPVASSAWLDHEAGNFVWNVTPDNRLRYQLARRLAREGRLDEAAGFMPPALQPLFNHYRSLDKARASGGFTGPVLAAIAWRQACIHREWGAELFATDSTPDGWLYECNYPMDDFSQSRVMRDGWTKTWDDEEAPKNAPAEFPDDRAVPRVTAEELTRVSAHRLPHNERFHYRYVAADLAWVAAQSLPDNHPQLAALYNTAGQWLAARDPKAADRFYQAIVKRCKETPEGPLADKKRWFLDLERPEIPGIPPELLPPPEPAKMDPEPADE